MLAAGLLYALRVSVSLVAATVIAPLVIASPHRGASALVRFLSSLTVGFAYWMALGFLLGALHVLELAPLAAISVGAAFVVSRRRRVVPDPEVLRDRQASLALDAMDPGTPHSFLSIVAGYATRLGQAVGRTLGRLRDPVTVVAVVAVVYVAAVNLLGPLGQVSPGTSRGYTDLVAAKELAIGMGAFQGGVFPQGLQALVATMSTLLFTDALNIFRFMGVLGGLLLAVAAGALSDELTGSRTAGVLTVVLVGLTMVAGVATPSWQLTLPLGVKWATCFVLIGLAFGVRHFRERSARDLWVVGLAATVASLIDPRVAAFLPATLLAMTLGHYARPSQPGRPWRVFLFGLGGVAVGAAPLAAAHLAGAPWSLYMWAVQEPPHLLTGPALFLFGPRGAADAAAAGVLVLIGSFVGSTRRPWRPPILFGLGLAVVAAVAATRINLPAPLDVQDVALAGGFAGLLLIPAVVAWLLGGIVQEGHHVGAERLIAVVMGAVGVFLLPLHPPTLQRFEPVGSGRVYLTISENFPAYTWTIVSPTPQYSEVLGHGWHVELYDLVVDDPLSMASNPDFRPRDNAKLPIQTPDTFVYVYLQPFGLTRPFAPSDFTAALPSPSGSIYSGTNGAIVEAHALTWAKAYLKAHPKSSSIYFRNSDLMVLWIRQ